MTIIYRAEKGSPLSIDEIDGNFRALDKRLKSLEDHPERGEGLGKIDLRDNQITFRGTFGTDFGTFPFPSLLLPLYEKATLPQEEGLGKLALLMGESGPTPIFFNGTHWQYLTKGDTL